ncbi:MAG: hypothetical protein QNK37_36095 [Acidobacteriota bacterium]|nr:hypothetical protein [Acidobacteriota bacterium]
MLDLNRNVACPAEDPVADVVGEIKKEGPPTIMETIKAMISGGRWFFNMKGAFVPLVAAALLFFVFFPNTPAQGEMTFLPEDGSVELVRNRRSHDVHAFSIGEGEDFVVGWIADAPSDRVTGYRCLLKFEGTPVAVAEADLQTLKRHEFRVRFPAEELQSGRYSLEIYHLPDNSIIETYNIELTLVEVRE